MFQLISTLLFFYLVHSFPLSALRDTEVINTTYGPVRGKIVEGVKVFRSIPFAAPPVGLLRFAPPAPPEKWTAVKDCFEQQSICPQFREGKSIIGKEDCLYLDVYVPENAQGPLPVMYFVYGGGWVFGDSWEMGLYDGKNLAKTKNVVVVTVNYRLNAFGFLGLYELQKESPEGTTGNYGIQDQRFGLYWTQDNIKNFGGDPDRVLLFGESAGAFSTCIHLISPLSVRNGKKLFHAAILESGNCEANEFYLTMDQIDSFSADYAAVLGCNRTKINNDQNFLQCLRHLSEGGMMEGFASWFNGKWPLPGSGYRPLLAPVMPWGAAIDGSPSGLIGRPLELVQKGKWIQVPTIMGTNHNEGDIFLVGIPLIVPGGALPITDKIFNLTLLHFFGNNQTLVEQVADNYPKYLFKTNDARVSVILRDMFFVCSTRRLLRAVSADGYDAFMYHFTYQGDWIEDPILGDYHSSELEYVFHNPWPPLVHAFSKKDKEMADIFGTYWSSHAYFTTPNRNGSAYLSWPKYNQTADMNIVLNVPLALQSRLYSGQCDFWDTVPAQYR